MVDHTAKRDRLLFEQPGVRPGSSLVRAWAAEAVALSAGGVYSVGKRVKAQTGIGVSRGDPAPL